MKSIMEEASTIFKAVESAWQRAGKPQEFTVKILEHPETGFLGLKTVKSAKIALFFNEQIARHETDRHYTRPTQPSSRPDRPAPRSPEQRPATPRQLQPSSPAPQRREPMAQPRRDFAPQQRPSWTPEMVAAAQEWVKETLHMMGQLDVNVKAHVSHHYLKLMLDKPVAPDMQQEEVLLKSWSGLAIESLREKFKQPVRGLRLVLESSKR